MTNPAPLTTSQTRVSSTSSFADWRWFGVVIASLVCAAFWTAAIGFLGRAAGYPIELATLAIAGTLIALFVATIASAMPEDEG